MRKERREECERARAEIDMKKMYLKHHPHFNFIGRYEFENKHLFVLVWRLVKANEGSKDTKQRISKFIVEVLNVF